MGNSYELYIVQPDGVPRCLGEYGDQAMALYVRDMFRDLSGSVLTSRKHFYVIDSNDPERGNMEWDEDGVSEAGKDQGSAPRVSEPPSTAPLRSDGLANAEAVADEGAEAENKRLREKLKALEDGVWDVQQECARLDFVGKDDTARFVAHKLIALLADSEDGAPPDQGEEG